MRVLYSALHSWSNAIGTVPVSGLGHEYMRVLYSALYSWSKAIGPVPEKHNVGNMEVLVFALIISIS